VSFVIGLTGSIAMGKSQTARLFAEQNIPVFDADAAVHAFYAPGGAAVDAIAAAFPGTVTDGGVNRGLLSAALGGDTAKLAALEQIVHPLTLDARNRFLARHAADAIVLLDIPLLLEARVPVDAVVVASAPQSVQRARALERPGMTAEKFAALAARQMPDAQKRQQAHYVVMTDKGLDHAREQVTMILADIRKKLADA
jgi:dephospho-CoA kinase